MRIGIKKTAVGQNITLIIDDYVNDPVKYTKRVSDKDERLAFISKIDSLKESIEKAKSDKVGNKHIDTLINMFTSVTKEVEKKEEVKKVEEKAVKKRIDKINKSELKGEKTEKKREKLYNIGVLKSISKNTVKEELDLLIVTKEGMVLKGFESIPMPKLLVAKIEEFSKRGVSIKFLINFWYKCLANPNHIARTKLFDYLVGQNIIITESGNIVTYRMVKDVNKDGSKLDGYYTDAHTHTMRYYPKTVCFIPRSECDEDGSKDCSKGLHTGNPKFIGINVEKSDKNGLGDGYNSGVTYEASKESGYSAGYGTGYNTPKPAPKEVKFDHSFGNVPIICIVNPSNVVSVPNSDTRKMRSCEFYFVKVTTVEEVIALEAGDYLLFDEDYEKIEIETLKDTIKEQGLTKYINNDAYRPSDLTKLKNKLEGQLIKLKVNDSVSKDLSLEQIKLLVNNRIKQ